MHMYMQLQIVDQTGSKRTGKSANFYEEVLCDNQGSFGSLANKGTSCRELTRSMQSLYITYVSFSYLHRVLGIDTALHNLSVVARLLGLPRPQYKLGDMKSR